MTIIRSIAAVAVISLALGASAKESKQNHHCKMPDGSMDMAKTKRECKAAKGTWAKDEGSEAKSPEAAAPDKAPEGKTPDAKTPPSAK